MTFILFPTGTRRFCKADRFQRHAKWMWTFYSSGWYIVSLRSPEISLSNCWGIVKRSLVCSIENISWNTQYTLEVGAIMSREVIDEFTCMIMRIWSVESYHYSVVDLLADESHSHSRNDSRALGNYMADIRAPGKSRRLISEFRER